LVSSVEVLLLWGSFCVLMVVDWKSVSCTSIASENNNRWKHIMYNTVWKEMLKRYHIRWKKTNNFNHIMQNHFFYKGAQLQRAKRTKIELGLVLFLLWFTTWWKEVLALLVRSYWYIYSSCSQIQNDFFAIIYFPFTIFNSIFLKTSDQFV
jgi:hypothetical protein